MLRSPFSTTPVGYFAPPNPYRYWVLCAMFLGFSLCCGWAVVSGEPIRNDATPTSTPGQRVLADIADGSLDEHDLFTAAIIVSGCDSPNEIEQYQRRIEQMTFRWKSAGWNQSQRASETQGEHILALLHEELLSGDYDPGCGDLRRVFETGDFNCATTTILFQVLARQCGLHPVTIGLPGHVRCRVGDRTLETTSANGQLPEDTDFIATDAERELTDVQLLAKLIYNQGLTHLASRRFAQALETTELSWQLDPGHDEARQNVVAIVNNWALRLCSPGTYEQAIELLRRGQAMAPDHGTLALNERQVLLAWWAHAVADGDEALARRIRDTAKTRYPRLRMQ